MAASIIEISETEIVIISQIGPQGPPAIGAVAGGTTGQALAKASGDDYDYTWQNFDPAGSAASAQAAAIATASADATAKVLVETNRATAAEALLAPIASPTFTGTVGGITKTMVGLGNVDNTSDVNKPVSTAQQTALDL